MKKSFWVPIALALVAYLVLPLPGLSAPLSDRIEKKRDADRRGEAQGGRAHHDHPRFNTRIEGLQGEIQATQSAARPRAGRPRPQKDELLEVRDRLEEARDRLERLRSELATARKVLAARLVEIYKADAPDALTVVLEADGFADLLERTEFLDRISDQDREITDRVRGLRDQAQTRPSSWRRSRSASSSRPSGSCASATRSPPRGTSSCPRATSCAARADRRGALAQVRDQRESLEGDLRVARGRAGARRRRAPGPAPPAPGARSGRARAS